ncbi:MAG TPA: gluconate 2-dehydrogenase subunit 3 family protein [Longimicrobiales bacterium]|nr:gluconate 2-dehydrogenase subunit 3 family protein [Longimicrobiales bacterium]
MAEPPIRPPHVLPGRRAFLARSGAALGGAWLGLSLPLLEACGREARRAAEEGLPLRFLAPDEAAALDALTARIIPTDETPGAREMGVVRFIDQALADDLLPGIDEPVRGVISMADGLAAERGSPRFADLSEADQDAVLEQVVEPEDSPYPALSAMTAFAMFSDPSYGGNRDEAGWRLIGFETASGWQPPFGDYDREYREQGGAP